MLRVLYPRILFRTSRAASTLLVAEFTMALTLVAIVAGRPARSPADLALLFACVFIPSALAFRVLRMLGELEHQHSEPDATMVLLFDLSLMLPVLSLIFAGYAMNATG